MTNSNELHNVPWSQTVKDDFKDDRGKERDGLYRITIEYSEGRGNPPVEKIYYIDGSNDTTVFRGIGNLIRHLYNIRKNYDSKSRSSESGIPVESAYDRQGDEGITSEN